MARENQGLQIALIVAVMLTIVLAVTTFIFWRNYDEADLKAKANLDLANKASQEEKARTEEVKDLKRLLGVAETEKLETIHEQFAQDMQTYAGSFPEEKRFYRPVLEYLNTVIKNKNEELAAAKLEIQNWKDKYETREASKEPQLKQFQQAAAQAGQDLASERDKYNADRTRLAKQESDVAGQLQQVRKDNEVAVGKIDEKVKGLEGDVQKWIAIATSKSRQLDAAIKETFDVADGEIRWVNQRNGTVWIDLGRADGLNRQTTFSVYPANTSDLAKAGRKASIEVTQILGEHLAEARVTDDKIADPILPGDKIHTPVWSPGERRRFALAGFMDVDGDGKSDLQLVRNLITMNGGLIDAQINDKGEISGAMSVNTRYLVLGEAPTSETKGGSEIIKGYSELIGQADKLSVKKISVHELLSRMGWKTQATVVHLGPAANPNEFRVQPAAGTSRAPGGSESGALKERRPPKSSGGGS